MSIRERYIHLAVTASRREGEADDAEYKAKELDARREERMYNTSYLLNDYMILYLEVNIKNQ